jgi:hypothetical protein
MLAIVGTVPSEDFPLVSGDITLDGDRIIIGDHHVPVNRGTPALMAAAVRASETLGKHPPMGYLVGDTGLGKGSRRLYKHMTEQLPGSHFDTLTFHYLQPIVHWHKELHQVLKTMNDRPCLIPDAGELAFLADEKAPHPFYTRGFILHDENHVPDLISRAYEHDNAARYLIVKGEKDYLANCDGILETVDSPVEEALEAMGGTGDTLTGLVSALIESGLPIRQAARAAMRANRLAGRYANPTPASQVMELIDHIPKALVEILEETQGAVVSNA